MTTPSALQGDVFVLDLDGTVYLEETEIDGASEVIRSLRGSGRRVFFLSNNSSMWKDVYISRLASMGIPASEEEIVLSTDHVVAYLGANDVTQLYLVGTEAMKRALVRNGISVTSDDPSHVVVGFDTELTYRKVRTASLLIQDGAGFVAAHPDKVCPTPEGDVPDCGSITALLETATGRSPERVLGKPDPMMLAPVYERSACEPEDIVIVGDRLETDIRLARNEGVTSVLVLSGDTDESDLEGSEIEPDFVVDSIAELPSIL